MRLNKKDIYRPIFGTITLQPPTYLWCEWTGLPYWSNVGLFTIIATIYLIPIYAWFERYYESIPPHKDI
tara:strand:- start:175 stop:381 length:207 start_codon:yes stop_codon:yes gene_type:complete